MIIPHPFFAHLPSDQCGVIARMLRPRALEEGEPLVLQGAPADSAFFLMDGRISVDVQLPGGGRAHLTELGPGGVLGELALVSEGQRRTATATALEPTKVLAMLRRDLSALCAQNHPASLALLRGLAEHVDRSLIRVSSERLELGRAPRVRIPDAEGRRPGADFEVSRVLPALRFAREMSPEEARELGALGRVWTFEPRRTRFRSGEGHPSIYLVIRGSVEQCAESGDGARRLALLGPGELVGELSLLTGERPRTITVVRDGATLLELPTAALAMLTDPERPLAHRFAQAMVRSRMVQLELATRALARERLGLSPPQEKR